MGSNGYGAARSGSKPACTDADAGPERPRATSHADAEGPRATSDATPERPRAPSDAEAAGPRATQAQRTYTRTLVDALLAVLWAPSCAACGEPLERPTQDAVCDRCWRSIVPLTPPLCDTCGDPLPAWRLVSLPLVRCPRCRRLPRAIDRGRAVGTYEGSLRAIVHALKYDGRRSLARPLAALMRERGHEMLDGADAVVPVPLHRSRCHERGFNQAADLAKYLDLPVAIALRRVRATAAQASLPAARRHRNVRGAFAATRRAARLQGKVVVVVDDVSTTGATLDACAVVLKEAGVREVRALTAARVATLRP